MSALLLNRPYFPTGWLRFSAEERCGDLACWPRTHEARFFHARQPEKCSAPLIWGLPAVTAGLRPETSNENRRQPPIFRRVSLTWPCARASPAGCVWPLCYNSAQLLQHRRSGRAQPPKGPSGRRAWEGAAPERTIGQAGLGGGSPRKNHRAGGLGRAQPSQKNPHRIH
jgi:hypothetical protein